MGKLLEQGKPETPHDLMTIPEDLEAFSYSHKGEQDTN
jgi:hypothetical protein